MAIIEGGVRRMALSSTAALTATFLFANAAAAQDAAAPTSDTPVAQSQADDAAQDAPEIVVTGSSIRGVPPTGSNLISVGREDIETIGASTTADLLATVPQLNSFNTAPRAANAGAGAFAPGLRGLPPSATLPLMNGHRLISGGNNQTNPDYPFLPELAIERVEIVADGASSIYGSDAVAGVVNFVTRKRYSGLEASVRYGMADDYSSFNGNLLGGTDWGSGSVLVAYQYSQNSNITGGDRSYRITDFRPYGGTDTRSASCPDANVRVDATAYAVYYAAPALAPGSRNYCDSGAHADLVPESRLHSIFGSARQELSDNITLWGEVLYSDRKDTVQAAPGVLGVFLPASSPFFQAPPSAPGATTEYVEYRADNLYGRNYIDNLYRVKAGNSSAGVDIGLGSDIELSVYGTFDWGSNHAYQPVLNTAAASAAALAGTLDPFGNDTPASVADAITNLTVDVTSSQRIYLGAARIDGSLIDLPGGALKFAAGAEYRRETRKQTGTYYGFPVPEDQARNIESVFGELYVPIFGAANETAMLHRLALSLSGRYDHYSDFGDTVNPKFGVDWSPVEGVAFRASYGRSFRAPGLREVAATVGAYYVSTANLAANGLIDPTRGAAQVNTIYLLGGNRDLQPEKARTYSFGVDLQPTMLPGLRASATYYDIHYTDVIGQPPVTLVFSDPTFATVVARDPTPAELASFIALGIPSGFPDPLPPIGNLIDRRNGNFGVRDTNGIDFDVSYRHTTGFGALYAGIAGNYILNFDTQLSPTAPTSNSLKLGLPRATFRITAGATAGPVNFTTFVNYRDGVTSTYATPTGTAEYSSDPYTTVDLRFSVDLPDTGLASGTQFQIQVDDLFDAKPPFFPATDGIGGTYNPIGRYVALGLRKAF
ncbi:TonB-dependent receptor plug domain-containing protein [Stakelama tenebrarum]|uniref:TonB-dependent receptor n=1 Tax=Stakelama tenebrarum TaxID=2711215 RepID=A0A6G6Y1Z6_9SPHN|nr:TonB-dependent receptor [Sphingosinithalassobacter tenebrarum]QIG78596.1 TonB-dependent receptor [Sphingosinithalassobacter tenebrarum]